MIKLTDEIIKNYQIRKTKKQKTEFIELLRAHFPEMRIESGGFFKCRNLVIGDVESAKVVFGAHYDTAAALPIPNLLFPKNPLLFVLCQFLIVVPMIFFMLAVGITVLVLTDSLLLYCLAAAAAWFLFSWLLIGGRANRHTMNDNTSGVATLCEAIERMEPERRRDAAFVFFDQEETGLWGSLFFMKTHRAAMSEKLLVNFDCVSDGDQFMIVGNKKARERHGSALRRAFPDMEGKCVRFERSATTLCPSDQMRFPCSAAAIALKKKKFLGLYLDRIHTKRDTVFQEENISYFAESICRLCDIMEEEEEEYEKGNRLGDN